MSGITLDSCGLNKIEFINCVKKSVDFQATPELQLIYSRIVSALYVDYDATVTGVEQYADAVFLTTSVVEKYENNVMFLNIGRLLDEAEVMAWTFIKESFPLPIGTELCLVIEE